MTVPGPVPRYFFDLHNDLDVRDDDGKEFPDVDAARVNALLEAREMIKASIDDTGMIDLRNHIDVRDEGGAVICVMHFQNAVTIQRGAQVLSQACPA